MSIAIKVIILSENFMGKWWWWWWWWWCWSLNQHLTTIKKEIHFKLKSCLQNLVAIINYFMVYPMDFIFQTWEFRKEKEKTEREYFGLTTFYFYCHFPQKSKAINNILSCAIRQAGWLARLHIRMYAFVHIQYTLK